MCKPLTNWLGDMALRNNLSTWSGPLRLPRINSLVEEMSISPIFSAVYVLSATNQSREWWLSTCLLSNQSMLIKASNQDHGSAFKKACNSLDKWFLFSLKHLVLISRTRGEKITMIQVVYQLASSSEKVHGCCENVFEQAKSKGHWLK